MMAGANWRKVNTEKVLDTFSERAKRGQLAMDLASQSGEVTTACRREAGNVQSTSIRISPARGTTMSLMKKMAAPNGAASSLKPSEARRMVVGAGGVAVGLGAEAPPQAPTDIAVASASHRCVGRAGANDAMTGAAPTGCK
jgi:hypothetical protein